MDADQIIRILIVDDNAKFREMLSGFLSGEADIKIIGEARDGEEAVRMVSGLEPSVVTLDVRMPGTNGLCALQAIKAIASPPKVIILTAFDSVEYREAAEAAGVDAYVEKKSLVKELIPAIRGAELENESSASSQEHKHS